MVIVMELVEGGTFDRLGPFEEGPEGDAILRGAEEVMEALKLSPSPVRLIFLRAPKAPAPASWGGYCSP